MNVNNTDKPLIVEVLNQSKKGGNNAIPTSSVSKPPSSNVIKKPEEDKTTKDEPKPKTSMTSLSDAPLLGKKPLFEDQVGFVETLSMKSKKNKSSLNPVIPKSSSSNKKEETQYEDDFE